MTKFLFIGICLVGCIGAFIYFVDGLSSTYAPIKTYDYAGNLHTLIRRLHLLTQDKKSLSFTITDTTGTDKTGYNYYFKLRWITPNPTDTIEYSIVLSKTNHWFTQNKTVIELVEAIDLTHLSGGYSQTANGVQPLIKRFDIYIIPALIHNKH